MFKFILILVLLIGSMSSWAGTSKKWSHDEQVTPSTSTTTATNTGTATDTNTTTNTTTSTTTSTSADSVGVAGDVTGGNPSSISKNGDIIGGDTSTGDNTVTIDTSSNYRRQTPNGYLHYSPNGDNCMRTLGFQGGNPGGIVSFGVPLRRDKACDIWRGVQEAQENGHILLSYALMCEVPNIRRVWGEDRCHTVVGLAENWWEGVLTGK